MHKPTKRQGWTRRSQPASASLRWLHILRGGEVENPHDQAFLSQKQSVIQASHPSPDDWLNIYSASEPVFWFAGYNINSSLYKCIFKIAFFSFKYFDKEEPWGRRMRGSFWFPCTRTILWKHKKIIETEIKKKSIHCKTTVTSHTSHSDHPVLQLQAYRCSTVQWQRHI